VSRGARTCHSVLLFWLGKTENGRGPAQTDCDRGCGSLPQ
jgi:hypothetical protein